MPAFYAKSWHYASDKRVDRLQESNISYVMQWREQ